MLSSVAAESRAVAVKSCLYVVFCCAARRSRVPSCRFDAFRDVLPLRRVWFRTAAQFSDVTYRRSVMSCPVSPLSLSLVRSRLAARHCLVSYCRFVLRSGVLPCRYVLRSMATSSQAVALRHVLCCRFTRWRVVSPLRYVSSRLIDFKQFHRKPATLHRLHAAQSDTPRKCEDSRHIVGFDPAARPLHGEMQFRPNRQHLMVADD